MAQGDFVKVAQVSAISPGDLTTVEVGGEQILLVNVDGDIHACDDICSHAYASILGHECCPREPAPNYENRCFLVYCRQVRNIVGLAVW